MAADADASTARRAVIHDAAIERFSVQGFTATAMGDIAAAAGMSRPALYQYFPNKHEIFASAFTALADAVVDAALAALDGPGAIAERLDGYLQRSDGDFWERLSASPHADEIIAAKDAFAERSVAPVFERLHGGLERQLRRFDGGGRSRAAIERRTQWMELLVLSPRGFKLDQPSVDVFRKRLGRLAHSVAAEIEASIASTR